MKLIAGVFFLFSAVAGTLTARTVSLAWNPSSDPDVIGYRVYYGTSSNLYDQILDLGSLTNATVADLGENDSYFFTVSCYTTMGTESVASNEVVSPIDLPPPPVPLVGRLLNMSVRGFVRSGDNVIIGGFMILGGSGKKVILRALGPSLADAGVPQAMLDPVLELHDATGAIIGKNSGWTSDQDEILATGLPPQDSREAALVTTLAPGAYSAILRSASESPSVALFEVYDLDPAGPSELVNISTRGRVEPGDHALIGGFIISGLAPVNVILRALGPSLQGAVADVLRDPVMTLFDPTGQVIAKNNDWAESQAALIIATGIPPVSPKEAAMVNSLSSGAYSGVVQGINNTSGNALVEIYNLGASAETAPGGP